MSLLATLVADVDCILEVSFFRALPVSGTQDMDDALDEALQRTPQQVSSSSRRRRQQQQQQQFDIQQQHNEQDEDVIRRTLSQPSPSSSIPRRSKYESVSDSSARHLPAPRLSTNSSRSNPAAQLDSNDDDSVMILRQPRRQKHASTRGLSEEFQSFHIGSHEPGPSSSRHIPNIDLVNGGSSSTSEELRPLQRHRVSADNRGLLQQQHHITVPLRGNVITSSDETQTMQLPFHPPSPRAARGEAKYRTPKPESQLRKLPRGFVWTDPESKLEIDAVAHQPPSETAAAAAPRFCGVRVPENTVYLVERAGTFNRILEPGFRMLVPGLDRVAYVFSKKMQKLSFATSHVHTADRVSLIVNVKLFYMVDDPVAAAYAVECVRDALVDLAAAAIHDEFGRVTVDALFSDLDTMWGKVSQQLNEACSVWGSRCIRLYTSIEMPPAIANTYERLAQARLEREIDNVTDTAATKRRELLREAQNERAAVASEGRALVLANETTAERDAITMKGEASAQALESIAQALEKPSGRDAAKVWIASKYIDALSIGLKGNKGTVSIDATGPARIVDEALNIMDANIRASRGNSPKSPVPGTNRRNTQTGVATQSARQHQSRSSNPSRSRQQTPLSPQPPTTVTPPSNRWPSLESNIEMNPLNAASLLECRTKRTKSGSSTKSGDTPFSIGGSRYFADNYNKRVSGAGASVSPPRMRLSSSRGSPPQVKGTTSTRSVGSPRPPRPPRRSRREGSGRSLEGITAADFLGPGERDGGGETKSPEAIRRAQQPMAERRSSGSALERVRPFLPIEPRESGSEDTIDRALSENIERICSGGTGTSAGDQAAAGLSPVGGSTFISQVSEGDDEMGALELAMGEVRAEMVSGWNGMARRKCRRKGSNGVPRVKGKSPNASSMTEDGEASPPIKASLEFRRTKRVVS